MFPFPALKPVLQAMSIHVGPDVGHLGSSLQLSVICAESHKKLQLLIAQLFGALNTFKPTAKFERTVQYISFN